MRIAANIGAALVTPVQNWASRSQAKMAEAQFNQVTMQNLQMQEQEIVKNREELELGFERLRSLPLPETNKQDILAEIDKFQENIQKKVKDKYTNAAEYIRKEGKRDLAALASTIQNSDAYKLGLRNKAILAQYEEDRKKGLVPMMVNGKTFDQQLAEFQAGKTKELTYLDPYKPSVEFVKSIGSSYGKDRFTKQQATVDEIVMEMIKTNPGMTPAQAIDQLTQSGYDKIPLFYKFDDKYDKAKYDLDMYEKRDRIASRRRRDAIAAESLNLQRVATLNALQQRVNVATQASLEAASGGEFVTRAEQVGKAGGKLGQGEKRVSTRPGDALGLQMDIGKALGFYEVEDKKTGVKSVTVPKDFVLKDAYGKPLNLAQKDRPVNFRRIESIRDKEGKIVKTYLVLDAKMSEDELEKYTGKQFTSGGGVFIGGDEVRKVDSSIWGSWGNDEVYEFTARVEVPIAGYDATSLSKKINVTPKDNQLMTVGGPALINNPNSALYGNR